MKVISKIYRMSLWVGFVFSAICLLASFFIKTPVEAGMHDIFVFRASGIVLFSVFTLAFAMKLFNHKTIFAIGKVRREMCYWVLVCIIAVFTTYFISFAHTKKYQSDYAAHISEQESSSEESSTVERNEESTMPVKTTESVTTISTTSTTVEIKTTTSLLIIETEPVTEDKTESINVSNSLIDTNGMTYYFDDKIEFEEFDVQINRLKLISDLDYVESEYNFYYIMIDYTIYNKSDNNIQFYLRKTGNIIGNFRFNGYERRLEGNANMKDNDFIETESFSISNGESVGSHKSINRYYCGIIDRESDDPKNGMQLRINDEMEVDLYFLVNDIYNIVTLEIN